MTLLTPERTDVALGLIPLTDCAPLAVAVELGFFEREGVRVTTSRERSWAAVRDKVAYGVLDGAQMIAPMLLSTSLGVGGVRRSLVTGVALSRNGNAITLSPVLAGAVEAAAGEAAPGDPLPADGVRGEAERRREAGEPRLRFGVVFGGSTHEFELRYWLAAGGVDPDRDVDLVVVPPPRMPSALGAGEVDGFCVGEPWNSVAVEAGFGRVAITKRQLRDGGPEKVLGVTETWARRHPATHAALIRGVAAGAAWVQRPENRAQAAGILARPEYVGEPESVIVRSLTGRFRTGREAAGEAEPAGDDRFHLFGGLGVNRPDPGDALWFLLEMLRWGMIARPIDVAAVAASVFRPGLYDAALAREAEPAPSGGARFFDGRGLDPDRPLTYLEGCTLHHRRVELADLAAAKAG